MKFCAFDISKDHLNAFFPLDEQHSLEELIINSIESISKFLEKIPREVILVAEFTGVYSDQLLSTGTSMGRQVALVHGYTLKHSLGMPKGKTDPIDARNIHEYAQRFCDKLELFQPNDEVIGELKELNTMRELLVKQRKMLKTRSKNNEHRCQSSILVHRTLQGQIQSLDQSIKLIEKDIYSLIRSDALLSDNYQLITSIGGIGKVTATELIIKTENFKRIDTHLKAASYIGICPFPNRSGNWVGRPKTSKRSDKKLKSLLFMCSRAASRSKPHFIQYKERKLADGKNYYLVMNNIANKLIRTVYAVIRTRTPYIPGFRPKDPRLL